MASLEQKVLALLRQLTGRPDALFHEDQLESIRALVGDRRRVLVVQRTGWGKSAVYFLATHLLRKSGFGPTMIISPLLVLMANQIDAAHRLGLRAISINSANEVTVDDLVAELVTDSIDVLLISPERLSNTDFRNRVMPLIGRRPGLIVIDEVHCISDWGHDFRPDYRRIGQYINLLPSGIPVLGCTATANDRVIADVAVQLGQGVRVIRGSLRRDSLDLKVLDLPDRASRLVWLDKNIDTFPGTGIVYCLTIRDVDLVADYLKSRGHEVLAYHGDMATEEREKTVTLFLENRIKAVIATSALGMGYDKPDVSFVVHYQSPGSIVSYYQQVGRAGRAVDSAPAILMRGAEDVRIQDYFIKSSFPNEETMSKILNVIDHATQEVSILNIESEVNLRHSQIVAVMKQLDVEGIVDQLPSRKYVRTLKPWKYPAERVARVDAVRRREQEQMVVYFNLDKCRMTFIVNSLNDPDLKACGRCDNCRGERLTGKFEPAEIDEAHNFLHRSTLAIKPRKYTAELKRIPKNEMSEVGEYLCNWRDDGYGDLVAQGKQTDKHFADELVDAMAAIVSGMAVTVKPTWVTCVPSSRSGELVPNFANRLATKLGLPFCPVVTKTRKTEQQKQMQNSVFQSANIEGAFSVSSLSEVGPVLLVDDLVDSGWTLTEVGRVLRRAGVEAVIPVVLSSSRPRKS